MTQRFLRLTEVVATTGVPRSTIYDMMDRGTFPKPVPLGERSVAWLENEIAAWQRSRIEAREGVAA